LNLPVKKLQECEKSWPSDSGCFGQLKNFRNVKKAGHLIALVGVFEK